MVEWDAEVEVTDALARALVADQHPDLADLPFRPLGEGFDNVAFTVGDWVFRFPRRTFGAEAMAVELRWLPTLPPLPLAIPRPTRLGLASERYGWPWGGYLHLPGRSADRADLDASARAAHAEPLGRFLAALHALAVPADAPADTLHRHDHVRRLPRVLERLEALPDVPYASEAHARAQELAATPAWNGRRVWCHGDLYARHLLVDDDGALTAAIDFGDMHAGDRAVDLGVAWAWLPRSVHATFKRAYGPIDDPTWARARFRALHYGAALIPYGRATSDRAMETTGTLALALAAPPQ